MLVADAEPTPAEIPVTAKVKAVQVENRAVRSKSVPLRILRLSY